MPHIDHETLLKLAHYDPGSGVFTRLSSGREMGRPDRKGYLLSTLRGSSFRLHRLAWYYMKGVWPADEIDHINGRPGDNRWSNLRECSHQENNHNQPLRRNNTSGVKGVYRNKNGKWHVQVCLNYKIHHGGFFDDLSEAERSAKELRARLHGEFANHG